MKKVLSVVLATMMGCLVASTAMASTIDPISSVTLSGNSDPNPSMNTVTMPAAAWLFGTGLIGVVGVARRRHD